MKVNINEPGECVLLDDLNIHVNKKDNQDKITLLNTLESFELQNWVEFPSIDSGTPYIFSSLSKILTSSKKQVGDH